MIRRISLGLAMVAATVGGLAGLYGVDSPAAPKAAAAQIHCELAWDVPDPTKTARTSANLPLLLRESSTTNRTADSVEQGYISAPYEFLPTKKTCTGGDPLEVTWESWIGSQHIDDLWFLNSSKDQIVASSSDPLGLRIWTGVAPSDSTDDISFNQKQIDIRLKTDMDIISSSWGTPWKFTRRLTKYSPASDSYVPHPNVGVTLQYRCYPSTTWLYYGRSNSDANGLFTFGINESTQCPASGVQLEVQGVVYNTPDSWGWTYRF